MNFDDVNRKQHRLECDNDEDEGCNCADEGYIIYPNSCDGRDDSDSSDLEDCN